MTELKTHKCRGECQCGQYVFEEDNDWMIQRFENIEKELKWMNRIMEALCLKILKL